MAESLAIIRSSLNKQMVNTKITEYYLPKRRLVQFNNGISFKPMTTRRAESQIMSRTRDLSEENYYEEDPWEVRSLIPNDEEVMEMLDIKTEGYSQAGVFSNKEFLHKYLKNKEYNKFITRIRNSAPGKYACLIARSRLSINTQLVGVVDATVMTEEQSTLSIFLDSVLEKQKVGTALLKSCEELAKSWGYAYLVLKVHQEGPQELFLKAGYQYVSVDNPKPKEKTVNFLGTEFTTGKERVMVKQVYRF